MHRAPVLVLASLIVLAYAAGLVVSGFSPALDGRMADGDAYMWLMRVTDLYRTGDWYAQAQVQTDAPFGETLHWTRPFDVVLLLGGLALAPFAGGFDAGLWAWGMMVSPVLLLAALPLLSWGLRPVLSGPSFVLAVALMLLLWRIGLAFMPARPDHHGFLGLLFVALTACLLRLGIAGAGGRVATAAGAVAGLALWASIEMLIALIYGAGVLALFWIAGWHRRADRLRSFLVAAALVVLAGLMLQRPPAEWLTERYAQLAAPHGWLTLVAAAAWAAVAWAEAHAAAPWPWRRRAVAAALAGATVAGAMAVLYPTFYAGPWVDYDVTMVPGWLATIAEFNALLPTTTDATAHFLVEAGPVLLALGWCGAALRDPVRRRPAVILGLGMALYLPLGLNQGRWLYYAHILALAPWALLIADAWRRAARTGLALRVPLRAAVVVALVTGPMLAGGAVLAAFAGDKPAKGTCGWVGMARHLKDTVPAGAIVLTHVFPGPELAWWSGLRVVGASYGHDAIWETWRFFRSPDDALPRAVIERRGVGYLLLCPADGESAVLGRDDPASLYSRLMAGQGPAWAVPVRLPGPLDGFRLFRIG